MGQVRRRSCYCGWPGDRLRNALLSCYVYTRMRYSHLSKILAPAAAVILALSVAGASSQESLQIALDADPAGNTPSTAATADGCVSVQPGDSFDVDILITNAEELLAFDIYIEYDEQLLEVSGKDTRLFLDSNTGSRVTDLSATVPDSDGLYDIAAVDTADPPRPDSGSGALARITFTALAPGTAEIQFAQRDVTGNGILDVGPFLRDVDLEILGDGDGDSFFDGQWPPIEARIGGLCNGSGPANTGNGGPGTAGGGDGGGIGEVALIALAAGAVALAGAVLAGGRYLLRRLNRSIA